MQAGSRPRMDAMDYPIKERKICHKCIKSREKAIVSDKVGTLPPSAVFTSGPSPCPPNVVDRS